jgi:hypothetical protein
VSTLPEARHEASDVNVVAILGAALGLLITAAVVHLLVWALMVFLSLGAAERPRQYPLGTAQAERVPPEPRLQQNPREDLRQLRAAEDELLNNYRWVDRNTGTIRIPITEAMRLTVERGLPTRTAAEEQR